jgi:hypothetical protein
MILLSMNKEDEFESVMEQYKSLTPDSPRYSFLMGRYHEFKGNIDKAEEFFRKSLSKLVPDESFELAEHIQFTHNNNGISLVPPETKQDFIAETSLTDLPSKSSLLNQ